MQVDNEPGECMKNYTFSRVSMTDDSAVIMHANTFISFASVAAFVIVVLIPQWIVGY